MFILFCVEAVAANNYTQKMTRLRLFVVLLHELFLGTALNCSVGQ